MHLIPCTYPVHHCIACASFWCAWEASGAVRGKFRKWKNFGACGASGKFFSKFRETLIHPKNCHVIEYLVLIRSRYTGYATAVVECPQCDEFILFVGRQSRNSYPVRAIDADFQHNDGRPRRDDDDSDARGYPPQSVIAAQWQVKRCDICGRAAADVSTSICTSTHVVTRWRRGIGFQYRALVSGRRRRGPRAPLRGSRRARQTA